MLVGIGFLTKISKKKFYFSGLKGFKESVAEFKKEKNDKALE
jgi:hypothetical protein